MSYQARIERRRVRWFFAGLVVISAVIEIVGALLVQHQTRSHVLETLLPAAVTLGGRTGAVLSGLSLLLLAGGIARGKRVAFRLTLLVLAATIAFELVKDLDFEAASLFAWIFAGLWWFRHHFDADSDPARLRWGLAIFVLGILMAGLYAVGGSVLLENQLQPEGGPLNALESLAASLAGSPTAYRALTERAGWFLASLPVVSYGLVILALTQLLRPVLAPRAAAADRERLHRALPAWGRNYISRLAVHGASSYHWIEGKACIAFTLRGRTALALGDPLGPSDTTREAIGEFIAYCDTQDWIPAFYQVDEPAPYRELGLTLIPIGAEALLRTSEFSLAGKKRADLRYATHRSENQGIRFQFAAGPDVLALHSEQLQAVSGRWLQSRHSPELSYSLGTLATLADPDIVVGLAFAADGLLEAFVSWLPVPTKKAWTLDLMRRRPDSSYGVMEALIVRSIEEAQRRGISELSLGVAPRVIASRDGAYGGDRALRAMYWGLDRFQRSGTLRRFKEKFGPRWEDRYLVVPSAATLPEVMVALARAHVPTAAAAAAWVRSLVTTRQEAEGRRAIA
jgi:phosphatidylglycerol lysyltransferase